MTWGAGRFGQLGNNCKNDSLELQDITDTVPQEAGKIIQVNQNFSRNFPKRPYIEEKRLKCYHKL